jgi:hypothetical protein
MDRHQVPHYQKNVGTIFEASGDWERWLPIHMVIHGSIWHPQVDGRRNLNMLLIRKLLLIPVGVTVLAIAACDTFSSIRRSEDNLVKSPDGDCVEKVLRATSEIEFVGRRHESTLWGPSQAQYYDYWILADSKKFSATISIFTRKDGKFRYSNMHGALNRHLSSEEKLFIPPALATVDENIRKACGIEIKTELQIAN